VAADFFSVEAWTKRGLQRFLTPENDSNSCRVPDHAEWIRRPRAGRAFQHPFTRHDQSAARKESSASSGLKRARWPSIGATLSSARCLVARSASM
jgi:hypothetical protein